MADEQPGNGNQAAPKETFQIKRIYLKDASFEAPNTPEIFFADWDQPSLKVGISSDDKQVSENTYEVVQTITVAAKVGETTAYLAEVQQAGLFVIEGISSEDMLPLLKSYCLTILYPYAGEVISGMVNKGGFPQVTLSPVNFDAVYERKLAETKKREAAAAETSN